MINNKLIAEFIGMQKTDIGWVDNKEQLSQYIYDEAGGNVHDILYFDKSWDWIMSVIEYIETLKYNTLISDFQTQISFNGLDNIQRNVVNIFSNKEFTKLEEVYKAIVEFILWYNLNKEK